MKNNSRSFFMAVIFPGLMLFPMLSRADWPYRSNVTFSCSYDVGSIGGDTDDLNGGRGLNAEFWWGKAGFRAAAIASGKVLDVTLPGEAVFNGEQITVPGLPGGGQMSTDFGCTLGAWATLLIEPSPVVSIGFNNQDLVALLSEISPLDMESLNLRWTGEKNFTPFLLGGSSARLPVRMEKHELVDVDIVKLLTLAGTEAGIHIYAMADWDIDLYGEKITSTNPQGIITSNNGALSTQHGGTTTLDYEARIDPKLTLTVNPDIYASIAYVLDFHTGDWISGSFSVDLPAANLPFDTQTVDLPELENIIVSGPNEQNEHSAVAYTATARYSDGGSRDVTADATWSVSSTDASFNNPGTLTASVPNDQTVTLTADYGGFSGNTTVTIKDIDRTVSVTPSPVNGGTATGGGAVWIGDSLTVAAQPNNGFEFTGWTENGTNISPLASYTFTVTDNRSLTANFIGTPEPTILTVNNGSGSGSYMNGTEVAIEANAPSTNITVFDQWVGDTQYVEYVNSPATAVTVPGTDIALTATYKTAFTYWISGNNCGIRSYTGSGGHLVIPDKINGYTVVDIDDGAFINCTSLTSVVIPGSVYTIGYQAFKNCSALTNVVISPGVSIIGSLAFENCYRLESITLPDSLTKIETGAFQSCRNLPAITIPANVTDIGSFAFRFCESLTRITVDERNPSYTCIDNVFFNKEQTELLRYLSNREDYTIPASVTNIAIGAFEDSESLHNLTIPTHVQRIDQSAFYGCSNLTNVFIYSGVTHIGYAAFAFCTQLDSVRIPNSVIDIREYAFAGCTNISALRFTGDAPCLGGSSAFAACDLLTIYRAEDASGWPTVPTKWPFSYAGSPTALWDPEFMLTVTNSGNDGRYTAGTIVPLAADTPSPELIFDRWIGDTQNVTDIFTASTTISMPREDTYLTATYKSAFSLYKNEDAKICEITGYNGPGGTLVIPETIDGYTVTSIGLRAFEHSTSLKSVTVPPSVFLIRYAAFADCTSLTNVNFLGDAPALEALVFLGSTNAVSHLAGMNGWPTVPDSWGSCETGFMRFELTLNNASTETAGPYTNGTAVSITADSPSNDQVFDQWIGATANVLDISNPATTMMMPAKAASLTATYKTAFIYTLSDANECTIVDYVGAGGDLVIPDAIDGYTVVAIETAAFEGCTNLTTITIPAGVKSIGERAFYNCPRLWEFTVDASNPIYCSINRGVYSKDQTTLILYPGAGDSSVNWPDSVTSIGPSAFAGCSTISVADIPETIKAIGENAFSDCSNLILVVIHGEVTSLENSTFNGCSRLQFILLPNSITAIGDHAFNGCSQLNSIRIPNSTTSIGNYAFNGCAQLSSVRIPINLSSIGSYAFANCDSLASIKFAGDAPDIGRDIFAGTPATVYYDWGKSDWPWIPGTAWWSLWAGRPTQTWIPEYQLYLAGGTPGGYSYHQPEQHVSITAEPNADFGEVFDHWTGDTQTVANIYSPSTTLIMPAGDVSLSAVITIGKRLSVTDGVGTGYYLPGRTASITADEAPEGKEFDCWTGATEYLADSAAASTAVTMPDGNIAVTATYRNKRYALTVNNGGGGGAYTNGTTVSITADAASAGQVFSQWTGTGIANASSETTTLTIPGADCSVTAIYRDDIWQTAIESNTVTITGYKGTNLIETVPAEIDGLPVTSVGGSAFLSENLRSITIPDSITAIGDAAFHSCASLTNVMIGSGVTSIGDAAFFGCSGLGNITIPDSVVTIGNGAFYSCTNLSGIVIPNSVTNIGEAAFYSCGALTNATLGSNVVSIGTSAFRKCTNLTAVAIPNSVTNIGVATFRDCSNLADITVNAANPTYCSLDGVLFDKDLTVLIQYPEGKTGDFTIPTTVTAIDDYAFHNCKRVESLILPNDVLSIGAGAFRNCTQLNSVTIPGSITNIGAYAFADCTDLTDVYVQCGTNSLNGLDPFENDGITVYHRAGTTGWDTALPGYSIFEWNPKALGLSMGRNGFEFTVTNAGSPSVKIEASTNLTDSVWEPMQTITLTDGSQTVTDSSSTNRPARFYRLSMP